MNGEVILRTLAQYAPTMPLNEAMRLVNAFTEMRAEQLEDAECLAVIASVLLNENGGILIEQLDNLMKRPAIRAAFSRLRLKHAWVVCSPSGQAMEELLRKWDIKHRQAEFVK